ncbi:MAG: hypothetical protein V8Q27_04850 [Eubacteriales bacterium]
MLKDMVVEDFSDETRTHKIFNALDEICHQFDLSKPIWLESCIADFKRTAKVRFYQDSFIDPIEFDYLEVQVMRRIIRRTPREEDCVPYSLHPAYSHPTGKLGPKGPRTVPPSGAARGVGNGTPAAITAGRLFSYGCFSKITLYIMSGTGFALQGKPGQTQFRTSYLITYYCLPKFLLS